MHLSSWIGGFLLGVVLSTVCAWIDGFFFRRASRKSITHARFFDYIDTLDSHGVDMLQGHLRWLEQVREQIRKEEARQA